MKPGDRIKIRELDGSKWWATVLRRESATQEIDATLSGVFGDPPSMFRQTVPGRTTVTLVLELEGPRE